MIFYNVISDVGEVDCGNDTYFTTTNKDLAEKYLQKYNEVKSKLEDLRQNFYETKQEYCDKLYFEMFGLKNTDEDFFEKLCALSSEEEQLLDNKVEEFVNNLPPEIRAGVFVNYLPELTIVESSDEMNFERFFYDSAEEDVKEYLKSLI